jgi:hypothetical protein
MAYLRGHFVPEDEKKEKQISLRACNYSIITKPCIEGVSMHHC